MKYIFIAISLLFFSCNTNTGKPEKSSMNNMLLDISISIDSWILDNQELKSLLSDYISEVKDDFGKEGHKEDHIQIDYRVLNDSTFRYVLSVGASINSFVDSPPHLLFKFEEQLICVYIEGLYIFKMNENVLVEFTKKHFPDYYNYYLELGCFPIVPSGGSLEWELVFQDDSLVSKKEYYTQ